MHDAGFPAMITPRSARVVLSSWAKAARAAPGPGSMLVTLIGWKVDGWCGALVATLALFVPSSLLSYAVARLWNRHRGKRWHTALEQGLGPVGAGLLLAGVVAIFRVAGAGLAAWAVALGAAVILAWRPRLHPLVLLTVGGLAFIALGPGAT